MIKHYAEIIFQAVLIAAIAVMAVLFQEFLPAAVLTSGAVFMMSFFKNSTKHNFLLSAVALACVSAACAYTHGLSVTALFTAVCVYLCIWAVGASIGLSARRKAAFISVIACGGICCLLSLLTWFFKYKFFDRIDIIEEFINKPVSQFFTVYSQMLNSTVENGQQLKEVFSNLQWYVQETAAMIIPSCFILICVFASYMVFICGRKLLSKAHAISLDDYPEFRQLQMPKSTSLVLAFLFIISFFTGTSNLSGAVTNIMIILSAFYMVCGLSLADDVISKKITRPVFRFIIFIFILCGSAFLGIIIPVFNLPSVLLLLGVLDSSIDFRRLRKGDVKNEH